MPFDSWPVQECHLVVNNMPKPLALFHPWLSPSVLLSKQVGMGANSETDAHVTFLVLGPALGLELSPIIV